jgi:hypothetical protein
MARTLSAASLSKYFEGGIYYDFLQYVKSDKELAFEIRVNDEVMIYCQKNLLLRISHRKNTSDISLCSTLAIIPIEKMV